MFEVLLQAGKALESGQLDQAEESYWQIVELDPSNAIAVAGLARVSMERGDRRLARTFAERALVLDPESAAARRTLEALDGGATAAPGPERPDLPLPTPVRLEASLRRPATDAEESAEDAVEVADDDSDRQLPESTSEPLPERRQPRAQAAEAAPRPHGPIRPKTHQALGDRIRRHLLPEGGESGPRADDPFAVAESAAAIEAVDETDDVVIDENVIRAGRVPGNATDKQGEVLGAVDATDEDESIAMRLALVSDEAQLEASELDADQMEAAAELEAAQIEAAELEAAELDEDVFGVAELVAAEELGSVPSRRIDLDALEASLQAAELRASEHVASGYSASAPAGADMKDDPAAAELEAAEPASTELAAKEPASGQIAEGTSAEDAEEAAFREALAMVLGSDGGDGADAGNAATGGATPAQPSPTGIPSTAGDAGPSTPEPSAIGDIPGEPAAEQAEPADSEATTEPRRKGFLRRFRGD